jgi:hypothetical protein
MAGAVEEGAKVAIGFMDALKREPLSLALVVMNLCLLLFFYVILSKVADQREREINLLYTDKKEVRELLAKCVVPDRDRRSEFDNRAENNSVLRLPPLKPLPPSLTVPLPPLKPLESTPEAKQK